ncbi:hypothetical protein [Rudaea sp.]|uniref:hypothetical protein n=1 Tax=Rudaea sp. TaxID=2136325 RepID=UPI00321F96C6
MNLIALLLLTSFPIIFAVLVSAVLWKRLRWKALFVVVCVLALSGLGDIGYQIISGILAPPLPNPVPNSIALAKTMASASILSMALADGLVVLIGIPLSRWLFSALRKQNPTASPL